MVTIKRIADKDSGNPTVTITLKGSTPDQDKLLYTLVGGVDEPVPVAELQNGIVSKKKKKKNPKTEPNQKAPVPVVITKELAVTVSLDAATTQDTKKSNKKDAKKNEKPLKQNVHKEMNGGLSMPMLRLPPGNILLLIPFFSLRFKIWF